MGTYDTARGGALHNPMFDADEEVTPFQEDVLSILEEANVETAVCDAVIRTVARYERALDSIPSTKGLREALEFYAREWRSPDYEMEPSPTLLQDCGQRARAALYPSPSENNHAE
jgi:hypothetical protein